VFSAQETSTHGENQDRTTQFRWTALVLRLAFYDRLLFTIGFLQLPFWKGVAALFIWPVYLGTAFSPLIQTVAKVAN
jgi:hypothetical protein